jgi:hypothetical protein
MPRPLGRPNKKILLTNTDYQGFKTEILEVTGIWIVTYKGDPVGIRRTNAMEHCKRYPRTGYNNGAHAYAMAARMNQEFNTEDFAVLLVGAEPDLDQL